jgi:dolichol kinase
MSVFVLLLVLIKFYYNERDNRKKLFEDTITQSVRLSDIQKMKVINSANKIKDAEDIIINILKKAGAMRHEKELFTDPTFYGVLSALLCLIFFGREITILAIITLAVGDSLSVLFGKMFGKHKIPWCKSKSVEGSTAFFGFVFIILIIFTSFFPELALMNPLILAFVAAFSGALIETVPTLTDNFTIPLFTGFIIYLVLLI